MKTTMKVSLVLAVVFAISGLSAGVLWGQAASKAGAAPAVSKDPKSAAQEFITAKSNNPKKIVLRYASTSRNLDDHPYMRGFRKFFEIIKTELGDQIEIQYFLGGALGVSTDAIIGGLQNGSFELTDWPLGSFAELTHTFQPLDVPYLITSPDEAMNLLNGEVGKIMTEKCIAETNIRPVFYGTIGMRQITNSRRKVQKPDDLKGLKLRVQNNPLHVAGMKALGCAPTPIAFGELFTSMQQKVVDGQENPLATIYDWKFYEVQKFLTITNHLYTAGMLAVNEAFYQKLPPKVKEVFAKAGKEASAFAHSEVKSAEAGYLEKLSGVITVYRPTPDEMKEFQTKAKAAWPDMKKVIGPEYFDKVVKAAGL
jgi:tripartite ATP-independent transporter DctP family solute receptor